MWDACVPLPMCWVLEPLDDLPEEAHGTARLLAQGVTTRCRPARPRSDRTASATHSTVPTTNGVLKSRSSQSQIRLPQPPSPIKPVTVTKPTAVPDASR